jgi:hypothetical protein
MGGEVQRKAEQARGKKTEGAHWEDSVFAHILPPALDKSKADALRCRAIHAFGA